MKVLFLSKDFSYNGGGERMLANLANELCKYHDITILSFDKTDKQCLYILDKRITFIKASIPAKRINFFTKFEYLKFLKNNNQLINDFDVIIGVGIICNIILATISGKIKPVSIGWEHNSFHGIPFWQQLIRNLLFPKLDKVICLTYKDLNKYKRINKNIHVIYNFTNIIYNHPPKLDAKKFIYIGRLTKAKGFDSLLDCIKKFCDINKTWSFEIIGEGEYLKKLLELKKNTNYTKRINYIKRTDMVQKELENSSCMLMMSRHEGLPMVLIEAQSCGIPVISYDTETGPSEIVSDKKSGFIIKNNKKKEFLNAMMSFAENEELLQSFSRNAILQSKRFNVDEIIPQWEKVLTE